MLSQLVYVSRRNENCTAEEIENILQACLRNNDKIDVTGVLLYSNTHFIQYLEGDYRKITGVYDKIKQDSRHRNVALITTGPIKERSFPSWKMGSREFSETTLKYHQHLNQEEKEIFHSLLSGKEHNNSVDLIRKFFR